MMKTAARARVLSALSAVDAVVVCFDEDSLRRLINRSLQPDLRGEGRRNLFDRTIVAAECRSGARWDGAI